VELGKALGAKVVAAASSEEKVALAKARGADVGVVYPTGPLDRDAQRALTNAFKEACGPNGADLVYDAVGGDYAEPALRAMNWEGRYLVIGFAAGIPKIPLNLALLKSCDIVGVFWGVSVDRDREGARRDIQTLLALYEAGKIKPHVSAKFPLARGGEAIELLASRKAMGKVVVTMD
jgi:NADPH:quinone reductase